MNSQNMYGINEFIYGKKIYEFICGAYMISYIGRKYMNSYVRMYEFIYVDI